MASKHVILCLLLVLVFPLHVFCVSAVKINKRTTSLSIIKELNRRGPYIGLLTVIPTEEDAFFATGSFKPDPKYPFIDLSGRRFRIGQVLGKKVIYVRCGVGMVNAAATTQQMLDFFNVEGIVHFGIAGNANNSMSVGDVSIPSQVAHTGIWDWLNSEGKMDEDDVADLHIGSYNVPQGNKTNLLGHITYNTEEFFSASGTPNTFQPLLWANIRSQWLQIASKLKLCLMTYNLLNLLKLDIITSGFETRAVCKFKLVLTTKPKLVVGLRASTANVFIDNAAYRDFLFQTFHVSSVDMESSAVVMTSLSNGFPVIVIRGLSDLAGRQEGENQMDKFGSLAALNSVKAVLEFIGKLP